MIRSELLFLVCICTIIFIMYLFKPVESFTDEGAGNALSVAVNATKDTGSLGYGITDAYGQHKSKCLTGNQVTYSLDKWGQPKAIKGIHPSTQTERSSIFPEISNSEYTGTGGESLSPKILQFSNSNKTNKALALAAKQYGAPYSCNTDKWFGNNIASDKLSDGSNFNFTFDNSIVDSPSNVNAEIMPTKMDLSKLKKNIQQDVYTGKANPYPTNCKPRCACPGDIDYGAVIKTPEGDVSYEGVCKVNPQNNEALKHLYGWGLNNEPKTSQTIYDINTAGNAWGIQYGKEIQELYKKLQEAKDKLTDDNVKLPGLKTKCNNFLSNTEEWLSGGLDHSYCDQKDQTAKEIQTLTNTTIPDLKQQIKQKQMDIAYINTRSNPQAERSSKAPHMPGAIGEDTPIKLKNMNQKDYDGITDTICPMPYLEGAGTKSGMDIQGVPDIENPIKQPGFYYKYEDAPKIKEYYSQLGLTCDWGSGGTSGQDLEGPHYYPYPPYGGQTGEQLETARTPIEDSLNIPSNTAGRYYDPKL